MEKKFSDLAIVFYGTDRYEFLWNAWYWYFKKNWDINLCNAYFLNEEKEVNFPGVKQIKVNIQDFNLWTKRLRESLKQIPENDIFFFMGDLFFIKGGCLTRLIYWFMTSSLTGIINSSTS